MIRPIADNCLLVLEPDRPTQTAAGIFMVPGESSKAYANRIGYVLAVGPGHHQPRKYRATDDAFERSAFQPTTVQPGEKVIVHVNAGDRYTYTKRQDMADMYARQLSEWGIPFETAEFRVIREAEILAVIESSEVREGSVAAE